MNCRFCQTPMLPIQDIPPDSDALVDHYTLWECHCCPATVKQYDSDEDWFSLMTFHNGHWYEVMQMYTSIGSKEPPLLSIYKLTMYEDDFDRQNIKSSLILEINVDGQITPQNIKTKLATILTFS
jgi:hypothetical protein